MAKTKERVDEATGSIFRHLVGTLGKYKQYSAEERLKYVEDAFHFVNNLYGAKHRTYNPEQTKFGFYLGAPIGDGIEAIANGYGRSVSVNLVYALKCNNPFLIYRTMLHEFRHIQAGRIHSPENIKLYDSKIYGPNLWGASIGEIGADLSAYRMLKAVGKYGAEKTDEEYGTKKILETNEEVGKIVRSSHLKSIAVVASLGLAKLFFSRKEAKRVSSEEEQKEPRFDYARVNREISASEEFGGKHARVKFFSRAQVCKFFRENPDIKPLSRSEEDMITLGKRIGEYAIQNGERNHIYTNFFGKVGHSFLGLFGLRRRFRDNECARYDKFGNLREEIRQEEEQIFGESREISEEENKGESQTEKGDEQLDKSQGQGEDKQSSQTGLTDNAYGKSVASEEILSQGENEQVAETIALGEDAQRDLAAFMALENEKTGQEATQDNAQVMEPDSGD